MDFGGSAWMRVCWIFLLVAASSGCDSSKPTTQDSSPSDTSSAGDAASQSVSSASKKPERNSIEASTTDQASDQTSDDSRIESESDSGALVNSDNDARLEPSETTEHGELSESITTEESDAASVDSESTQPGAPQELNVIGASEISEASAADDSADEDGANEHEVATAESQDEHTPSNQQRPELNWPKPKVVFAFTGRQHGYIEPCGCQTLAEQKGGLSRRHTFLRELSEGRGWNVVPLDVGDQVRRFGRQSEIKFQFTVEGMKEMNYRAIAFGPDDLHLSIDELAAATAQFGNQETPFTSANIAVLDRDLTPRFKIIDADGVRIGVTSVLGDKAIASLKVDEVLAETAVEALKATYALLAAEECDYYVLLAHATREETEKLAQAVPHFDLVVTSDGGEIPPNQLSKIAGTDSQLVEIGPKGMYVGVVGMFDDATTPVRYELVPLNAGFEDSRRMLDLMAQYQKQLENLGFEGLGVRPLNHPSGRKFVGSEKCGECHTKAFEIWTETPHHHATDSLVNPTERSEIPRHFDPECLSCHVTGWNPQRFVPYDSGYLSLATTPLMVGNGCENCHGPGSAHVAAESGDTDVDEAALKMLRSEMVLPLTEAENRCVECHDLDNSPEFDFKSYWEQVVHEGTD